MEKKNWFRKHWVLTTMIGIIVIIIAEMFVSSLNLPSNSDSGQDSLEKYHCPDLSNLSNNMTVNLAQTWKVKTWKATIAPYKSGNLEMIYTYYSQIEENTNTIRCEAGSQEGQNANWIYCGDTLRPIIAQYTDNNGNIIKKRSVEVTFDKNTKQYLATKCDTYPTF